MLKFDPDDPDDDDPSAAPPKVTIKLGGDDVRPSEPSDGAGDRNVPDKARQNTQHDQQKVKTGVHYSACDGFYPESSFWEKPSLRLVIFCFPRIEPKKVVGRMISLTRVCLGLNL
jgi:hypothetical protein